MTSTVPADKMQSTGVLLSRLTGAAVAGMLIFIVLFLWANSSSGTEARAGSPHFLNGLAQALCVIVLACEAVAIGLLLVGVVRWRGRVFRSWRWMLSALGVGFVAALTLVVIYIYVVVAISGQST